MPEIFRQFDQTTRMENYILFANEQQRAFTDNINNSATASARL